jgi:hypothetical protein
VPLFDFRCLVCGDQAIDIYRPISVGAKADPPLCCDQPMEVIPQLGGLDTYAIGTAFDVMDGRNQPVHVDSLRKLRQVEADSEKMARDGVGQRMVWRRYAQNASNIHKHSLKDDPSESPTPEAARKFSPLRHGKTAPDRAYGPGVSDANTSALKE